MRQAAGRKRAHGARPRIRRRARRQRHRHPVMHRLTGPDRYERADMNRIEMNALAELISRAGHAYGGRQALVGERRSMSFAEVDADSNRLASALALRLGVVKGERVAILLPNCPEFVVADF